MDVQDLRRKKQKPKKLQSRCNATSSLGRTVKRPAQWFRGKNRWNALKRSLWKRKRIADLRDTPHAYISHSARLWRRAMCPSWASCTASRSSRFPWWGLIMSSAVWKKGPCCLWTSTGWTSQPPIRRRARKVPALYFYLSFLMNLFTSYKTFCFLPSAFSS